MLQLSCKITDTMLTRVLWIESCTDWNARTNRNWRYHKTVGMWLTKDPNFPEPTPINAEAERGSYIFFNHQSWQRARVKLHSISIDLNVDSFHDRRNSSCSMIFWTTIFGCDQTEPCRDDSRSTTPYKRLRGDHFLSLIETTP